VGATTHERTFLREKNGKYYLVRRSVVGGKRQEHWAPLAGIDREILEAALQVKNDVQRETVEVPCMNPQCRNKILMTKKQLEEFFISSKKRYNLMVFPFCSTKCRDEVLAQHGGTLDGDDQS